MMWCKQENKPCYRTFCMMFSFKNVLVPFSGYEIRYYCKAGLMEEKMQ